MKQLILSGSFLLLLTTMSYGNDVLNPTFFTKNSKVNSLKKIKINITLKSKEGCKFVIKGDYNTWTGTFTGTVTASGPGDCPEGTFTFGLVIHDDGSSDIRGDNEFTSILKEDKELLSDLINAIKNTY